MRYAINGGNSTSGAVGFVFNVDADSREEALEKAKELLGGDYGVHVTVGSKGFAWLHLYVNADAIGIDDVEEFEDEDDDV